MEIAGNSKAYLSTSLPCSGRRGGKGGVGGGGVEHAFLGVPSHIAVLGCRAATPLQACLTSGEEVSTPV